MPLYEYRCKACGKITEFLLLRSDEEETVVCKYCGSKNLDKLISKPAAVIMGNSRSKGSTCCGRTERCDTPPCSSDGTCKRD